MVMREGTRWLTVLGVLGFAVGAWVQSAGAREGTQLASRVHDYYAECHNPDTELCSVKSPEPSLYMYTVLTPDIPFDDLGAHWVVDLRKFQPAKSAVKVLRVASNAGDVHAIHLKLIYDKTALAHAARKPVPVAASTPPPAVPQPALPTSATTVANTASRSGSAPTARGERSSEPAATSSLARTGQAGPSNPSSSASPTRTEGTSVEQLGVKKTGPKATATSTSEASPAVQLPCLDGICLGASIQTLNAPFEPVMTLSEQLRSGLTANSKLPPHAEDSFKRMEAFYRKGDKDGLEKEVATWSSPGYERDQLRRNLFHLVQAYELAEQALGGKRNADTADLAMYFVPQPENRKNGLHQTVNIKTYPMSFATGKSLYFDQGLPKLMAKTKPVFCGVFHLEGHYKSKSGYSTTVAVQTDSDGDFKVSTMERLFTNVSHDSLQQLHKELEQRYASPVNANIAWLIQDTSKVQLVFMHPIMNPKAGAGHDEASKLFQALWQQGWMDFKGKNVGWPVAMKTIANHNKNSIAACKPKALPMD
ncbi:hypothetical protein FSY59_12750 [Comamonas sp. Z3]|uniref:hypothetical protein n=1 Tax=Comamonas sp. Z3 TaxID=2601247 RepID=UPI0011E7D8D2|nr:hypothetical protein [Comamonas sp. Z3]TYK69415.1 hypothetical protein FSY59_18940 [Comamonas sp. Z3]TYK70424.1 hypothetical protein FSY59_12750 [Comamonas sp. Z3]